MSAYIDSQSVYTIKKRNQVTERKKEKMSTYLLVDEKVGMVFGISSVGGVTFDQSIIGGG